MGYKPGPLFSEILNFIEEAQLEGDLNNAKDARKAVLETYPVDEYTN